MRSRCHIGLGVVGLIAAAALAVPFAAGASPTAQASACKGVSTLSVPLVAIGLDELVLSLVGPLDDSVICRLVPLRRAAAAEPGEAAAGDARPRRRGCKNAQRKGYKLRAGVAAKAVRCLINAERSARGLGSLDPRESLRDAARDHTARMIGSGCFTHQCPGERDLVGRVTAAGYLPCGCAWSVGEDLAWGARKYSSPRSVVAAWMGSPAHRANVLNPAFKEVDVGVGKGQPGDRGSKAATYTADFGYRR